MTARSSTLLIAALGNCCALSIALMCMAAFATLALAGDGEATPLTVRQDGDHLQLEGMPAPAEDKGNTYARGMAAILSNLGQDVSYDRIMGLSGVAFILQVDTSGPTIDGGLDCAWWPNDAWGFTLGLPVLSKAAGWDIRHVQCNKESFAADPATEYARTLAPVVAESLKANKPLLAETNHGFVVTGTDGGTPPLLGYGTRGKSTQFSRNTMRLRGGYPCSMYVIGKKAPAASPKEIDLASLRHIVALFNEQALPADAPRTRHSGKQAWADWLALLKKALAEGDHSNYSAWDNNMLIHLCYNRRCAVAYLREMAGRYDGETAKYLTDAADLYQQGLKELMAGEMPHPGPTKGGLPAYTAMVERVASLEAQAVAHIEKALCVMDGKERVK
ncbi:MAG: hypothetical protein WC869_15430 [Phycisphaerae bacterium]|jgi:hypothetical protein